MTTSLRRFALALAALYAGWAVLRLALIPALEFDEAEQILHHQHGWRLLYGPQPPLFEWLVAMISTVLPPLGAVLLVKAAALWSLGVASAALARQSGATPEQASAAGWWTLTVPLLLWDAPRTLTHSLLASACVAAVVALSAPLLLQPQQPLSRGRWLGLGLLGAAAVLSKYNAALALAAWSLVLLAAHARAARADPNHRMRWRQHRGALWGLVPAAILLLVHGATVASAWDAVSTPIADKMRDGESGALHGLQEVAVAWLTALSLPLLLLWAAEPRRATAVGPASAPIRRVGGRWAMLYAAGVAVPLLVLVASGLLTDVHDRWMLPLAVPLLMLLGRAAWPVTARGNARLARWSGTLVVAALALLLMRPHVLAWLDRPAGSQFPARAAAAWVDRWGPDDAIVVAQPIQLAGALAAYGQRPRPVFFRHGSPLLLQARTVCHLLVVTAEPHPTVAWRLRELGFEPAHAPVQTVLPRQPAVSEPVSLHAHDWRHPGPTCPSLRSVYDHLP
ncbi:MAG: hypothetical protein NZ694_02550 [Tepidimonas sp.]|nr:hypothetical protein [Tepidimonas sp.]